MSVTESWSYTSKLGLDFIGKARRVLSLPRKSLLFFSCPQCWHLAGSLAATQQYCSSEAAEMFWHCIVLRPKKKNKNKGFSLAAVPCCGPTCTLWCGVEAGEQGEGVRADPSPFFAKRAGAVPAGSKPSLKRNRWEFRSDLWEGSYYK